MGRMGREFSLVLLGAGILTAGYFIWPEDDPIARAEEEAAQQVGAGRSGRTSHLVFLHGGRYGGARAGVGIARGGFGGIGHSISGVS
jgi:hypothetical protein